MKQITFEKLTLQNFMSIGSDELVFDVHNGLNLINGYDKDNPKKKNGIGKSTIAEGFFYGLYGDTIKKVTTSEIINDKNKKNGNVKLFLKISDGVSTKDVVIERKIKPAKCTLIVDGEDKTLSSVQKTNEAIAKMVGIDKTLFKQSVILSIGKSSPFFQLSKAEKRKFIEGIFDLNVFGSMFDDVKKSYNNKKKDLEYARNTYSNIENTLFKYKKLQENFDSEKEERIKRLKEKKEEMADEIKRLEQEIGVEEDVTELNKQRDEKEADANDVYKKVVELRSKVSTIKDKLSTLKRKLENIKDSCPECGRPYDNADELNKTKDEYRKKIQDLKNELEGIVTEGKEKKTEYDEKVSEVNKIKALIDKAVKKNNAIWKAEEHINHKKASLSDLDNQIKTEQEKKSQFLELIVEEEEKKKKANTTVKEEERELKIDEICKLVLSEEGVKSVIVNELTGYLNRKINKYLNMFNTGVRCDFDMYFSETLMNLYGVEKSYDSFSAGEQKRIDLAVLLTFQDILSEQSGIDIGISFYDEILDTSIDNDGREMILSLLKEKSKEHPVYIISHRGKMSDLIDKEITLEKRNDFTYIKEIK